MKWYFYSVGHVYKHSGYVFQIFPNVYRFWKILSHSVGLQMN